MDKSKLGPAAQKFLEESCCTSVLEIIKTEEIQPLIDRGLVRDRSEYEEILQDAKAILSHHCDQRCQIRIDHTGDFSKVFVCRKPHSLRDSLGNLVHSYISLPVTLPPTCGEILERIGVASSDDGKNVYNNAYFRTYPPHATLSTQCHM